MICRLVAGFPMPPPSGFFATKAFGYVGDYGYYTVLKSAVLGTGHYASDYRYVLYRGISGKRVFVYGTWGPTSVPPASGGADACAHLHASYGVWARWQFRIPFRGSRFLSAAGAFWEAAE
jgi:hypothetical protein